MTAPDFQVALANPIWRLLTAVAIGALIGIERERHKGEGVARGAAGLRTFALIALVGGLSVQSQSGILTILAGAFTAGASLLSYWLSDRRDPGLTTEVAMFATFLLGVEAQTDVTTAVALAVVMTVLLAWRTPLHHFARDVLSEQELSNGLIFAIAAVVILPFLPDRAVDPFGLVNPFALWRIVVVLMGLSGLGHVAARVLGPRYGLTITGFASGFISTSAGIAAMGARSRTDPASAGAAAAGAVAASVASLIYLAALVTAANDRLMAPLVVPLGVCLAATTVYAILLSWRELAKSQELPASGQAFKVTTVLIFAALMAAFSAVASVANAWLGTAGLLSTALIAGTIDVQAAAAAIATMIASGQAGIDSGYMAIMIALTANMLIKVPIAFATGTRGFGLRVSAGLLVLVVSLWLGALIR